MSETTPQVRVGDRERRVVDDELMAAVADGVLTLDEYDERSRALWQARTRADLDQLVADLPSATAAVPAPRPVPAEASTGPQRVVAVMSEDRFSAAVAPGQEVHGWAVMGKAVVDLKRDDLPDGVRVRVRSVMGEVEVQVPPGAVVHLSGLSVMGDRKVRAVPGNGPVVHIDAVAVMGDVKVTNGDGTVVTTGRRTRAPAARRPTSVAVPPSGAVARRSPRVARVLGRAKGLLVPVAVVGGLLLAGPDATAIFGSSVERVRDGQDSVAVSTLFGSVTVVVPDDVRVDTSGLVVFGGMECDAACGPGPAGGAAEVVDVRRVGAFGGIEIMTESEWDDARAADARDEAEDEAEDARDDD